MKKLLIFLMFIFLLSPLSATIYYVDASRPNDDGNGESEGAAWKTIGKVNSEMGNFSAGDSILFKRGETWTDAILTVDCDGSAGGGYITFGDYESGVKPIFDCEDTRNNGIFCIEGNSYLKFQNIWIINSADDSFVADQSNQDHFWLDGIDVTDSAHSAVYLTRVDTYIVENCTVDTCLLGGIVVIGSSGATVRVQDGIVRNNVVHDCGSDGITIHHEVSDNPDYKVGDNHLFHDNVSYDNGEQGFDVTSGKYIVLKDNESYGNGTSAYLIDDTLDHIWIIGHYAHDEYQGIFFNTAEDIVCRNSIFKSSSGCKYMVFQLDCINVYFVHNVVIDEHYQYAFVPDTGADGLFARNNIFTSQEAAYPSYHLKYDSPETPAGTNSDFDYNQYYRGDNDSSANLFYDATEGGHNLATRQTQWNEDENAQYGDPKLNVGFTLQSDSPCINAGTWLTTITSENGSGTSFVVGNAIFFQDGFGLSTGDEIQLEGDSTSATVTEVDYDTDTITVDESVSWTQGDGVAFAFNGTEPDMGAYEYEAGAILRIRDVLRIRNILRIK